MVSLRGAPREPRGDACPERCVRVAIAEELEALSVRGSESTLQRQTGLGQPGQQRFTDLIEAFG